ncbi:MAG: glutamyl-tRNA reductase [Planctomycetes bacterium]|nr:glutamyl-tRNA reductase [Planctomycetota bacterium]
MKLQVVGCSHHNASVEMRERLAFSPEQARDALSRLRHLYPGTETVVLSTCNRVELYFAAESAEQFPSHHDIVEFIAAFHGLDPLIVFNELFERTGEDAIRHLFTVAGSLDSMVVGEAQILPQVKEAYERATADDATGPLTHSAFQAAIRVAKRVARETAINQKRVSVPSVAVADFAKQFFERFDDKQVLLIGAGEMGEETLRYLIDEGAEYITIVNRSPDRAKELAERITGEVAPWSDLTQLLVKADIVVTTTGATEPIITAQDFRQIHHDRAQHPIFILDLAVPRDIEPTVSEFSGVYLYCVDDLKETCQSNQRAREKEWPKAERIIEDETAKFMAELHHRATGPTIRRLKEQADRVKADELERLLKKIPDLDDTAKSEITQTLNRVVNKLLHPPLESLRDEANSDSHHGLLDALKRLFQLKE